MTRIITIIITFTLMFNFSLAKKIKSIKSIKPIDSKKSVSIVVKEKAYRYYHLSKKDYTVISVKGPGKLKVFIRGILDNNDKDTHEYSIEYSIDGSEFKEMNFDNAKHSSMATFKYKKNATPGTLWEQLIKLGRGFHTIRVRSLTNKPDLLVKFLFHPVKAKKVSFITYDQTSNNEPINLIINEDVVRYYRFSKEKPIKVSVIGPTLLKVFTRVENSYDMLGRVNYRVRVKNNGKIMNTYMISSVRSEVARYKNNDKLVPGKAREITIQVPKGKNTYKIFPIDNNTSTLLGRLFIPKKDVHLEE